MKQDMKQEKMYPPKLLLNTLLVFHLFRLSIAIDTITANHSIKDGDTIVSEGKMFELGFFSPGNSLKRYVGIWYHNSSGQTVVWVANRDDPITGRAGVLSIDSHGNLVLYETNQTSTVPVWSTHMWITSSNGTVARLLDSGNLELVETGTANILWQSFDHPTHTKLPHMKLGLNRRTGQNWSLTSWKSPDDPGSGNYSYRIDPDGFPQLSIYNDSVKWWRAGSWSGQRWTGIPEMDTSGYITNHSFVDNHDEVSIVYTLTDPTNIISRIILNESGYVQHLTSTDGGHKWDVYWDNPHYPPCDYYGLCGPGSNCIHFNEFVCKCLPGFEPKDRQQWYSGIGTGGCRRKRGMPMCQRGEWFERVSHVKVPDTSVTRVDMSLDLKACTNRCLSDCSCVAYASAYFEATGGTKGCLTYHGEMMDTRSYSTRGQDLYVRVADPRDASVGKKAVVGIVIASFCAMVFMIAATTWFIRRGRKEKARKRKLSLSFNSLTINLDESFGRKEQDLPLLDLQTIATATNNFSVENKLGEGGFGPVYKGQLLNKQSIAVKRLSKESKQGIAEFKNEVLLIAKLQHKNLVRLLGCCIEKGEKMLIYEFMPNKSLDYFIFGDESRKPLLNWRKRFDIILGVARGILYLHQDSKLKIIHRDLKVSNILLDADMKPKISDFGTARIFGEDEIQANTKRVVGTYGYMSPEYISNGFFSTKSDIFSFGVIVLEIISGKRNRRLCHDDPFSYLIQHIWELWRDDKAMEVVDSCIGDLFPANEILRCIQVGLLCVQDKPKDRPSLSSIVFMLSNETKLPSPKKPTFVIRKNEPNSSTTRTKYSINEVTITTLDAR